MKIFFHNDLDGICSAAIFYKFFNKIQKEIQLIKINYDKEDEEFKKIKIEKNEIICMLDYSLSVSNVKQVLKFTDKIIWVDHHKTAIEKYKNNGFNFEGIQQIDHSGCMLAWMYCYGEKIPPLSVSLIEDFDIWKWEWREKTEPFKYFMESQPQNPTKEIWQNILNEDYDITSSINEGKSIVKYVKNINEQNMLDYSYRINWEGYKCLVINQLEKGSQTFEKFDNGDYDVLIVWRYNGQKYVVSLYHSQHHKNIDVSALAKKFGGGGHKGASGITFDVLPKEFLKNV